jgi:thiamine pyrophosphokinase
MRGWFEIKVQFLILVIAILVSILAVYYVQLHKKPQIYLFNESKFFTLTSLGILGDSKDHDLSSGQQLSKEEVDQIKEVMSKLRQTLSSSYKDTPIIIEKKNKQLEIYSDVKVIDITNDVTKEILGSKRWEQIGKTFLR